MRSRRESLSGQGRARMAPRMAVVVLRLLALVAFVLMPFGMTGAPAIASVGEGQAVTTFHATAGMDMSHCGDSQSGEDRAPAPKTMDCTAACTVIPAPSMPLTVRVMKPSTLRSVVPTLPFAGIAPEIATPPPKQA